MKHMKQKETPLSPTHETETQPQASGPPGRNFEPLHERKRSRREMGALKISAAVAAPTRMKGRMLEIFGLRYICGMLDTLLLHSAIHLPVCVRAIRVHCGSDLAILHTPAALDQMACPTIVGSESSAKLSRDGRSNYRYQMQKLNQQHSCDADLCLVNCNVQRKEESGKHMISFGL